MTDSSPSYLDSLETGVLRWDELRSFPEQDPEERKAGEVAAEEVGAFFEAAADPDVVDETGELPPGLIDSLRERGDFRLLFGPEHGGGRNLSWYNAFRVVERAAGVSAPFGQILGIHNGGSAAVLLPVLPQGPLRTYVAERLAQGAVSAWADTEPAGQNNHWPASTGTPVDGGSAYLLTGEKLFTGNGTVADLLVVTATVGEGGSRRAGLFFVDTRTPGFSVASRLEFMGLHGLPNGALRFDAVRVPAERVWLADEGDIRTSPQVTAVALLGRNFITSAPALAIARHCADWGREFTARRTINGRPLGDYDRIQRNLARTLADVYAMDSAVRWSFLGPGRTARWYEQLVLKNVCTVGAWRAVDRTLSLLAAEGYETVRSKRRRGAPALPVERAFRDARALRVMGNVDFQLDLQAGQLLLARRLRAPGAAPQGTDDLRIEDAFLAPADQEHLRAAARQIRELAREFDRLVAEQQDRAPLPAQQERLIVLNRIAVELITMCTVLARTSRAAEGGDSAAQDLADVWCTDARARLTALWWRAQATAGPDYARVAAAWPAGTAFSP